MFSFGVQLLSGFLGFCTVTLSLRPDGPLMQDVIVGERRFQYEAEVKKNPLNYDSWFDYIRLEEAAGDYDKIREVCSTSRANEHIQLGSSAIPCSRNAFPYIGQQLHCQLIHF